MVKVFNLSRKYLSTRLITTRSSVIHRILIKRKLNETCEVLLTTDYWLNRQMPSLIGIIVHFI